jgi:AAA domain-containing protein
MKRDAEAARLERLFGLRRDRLLDLSGRNPLVSYKHRDDDEISLPTLGIVAINTEQRELIRKELRLRASRDERVERFQEKAKARGEELFIKNLENVQGDERDTILISLTYGPKPGQSTPHQRFWPINGKHGHRRLNVLFSRARDRIVLFASLRADQIVADPGRSQGPRVLKAYLAYAEAGGQTVPDSVGGPADSDFEIEVRERLQQRGYTVDTQVGVSGYRIDLGVRNPTGQGSTWPASSATARATIRARARATATACGRIA